MENYVFRRLLRKILRKSFLVRLAKNVEPAGLSAIPEDVLADAIEKAIEEVLRHQPRDEKYIAALARAYLDLVSKERDFFNVWRKMLEEVDKKLQEFYPGEYVSARHREEDANIAIAVGSNAARRLEAQGYKIYPQYETEED